MGSDKFLNLLNDNRIALAEKSLQNMLGVTDLTGKKFLDIGSKIDAATPGLSLTPNKVNFASFFVKEIPLIVFLLKTANKVKNSATKPLVPGNPIEPKLKIKKKNANFGINVLSPLKKAISFV